MRKITQSEFDVFKVIDGRLQCPSGDYAEITVFGANCSFGERCGFGENCGLEKDKELIGNTIYSFGGFGSCNRTTYFIPTIDELWVRCGCFFGTIKQFRKQIRETHKGSAIEKEYLAICKVAMIRWNREKD